MNNINQLLSRSAQLQNALQDLFALGTADGSPRLVSSRVLCAVAFEHAESVKILIANANFTSAVGVFRLQYEALVRAMWLLYAASDSEVAKLTAELNAETAKQADKMPMLADMLTKLESSKISPQALDALKEIKLHHWKYLSSYVHGGIHAITRHGTGYPIGLLEQVLRASNGVLTMAGMMLLILSGDRTQSGRAKKIQDEYMDCLPPVAHP